MVFLWMKVCIHVVNTVVIQVIWGCKVVSSCAYLPGIVRCIAVALPKHTWRVRQCLFQFESEKNQFNNIWALFEKHITAFVKAAPQIVLSHTVKHKDNFKYPLFASGYFNWQDKHDWNDRARLRTYGYFRRFHELKCPLRLYQFSY